MTNVRTLRDINKGHRLGSMYEEELENKLYTALKSKTEVNDLSEKLQNKYSKQVKDFDRERKQWESAFDNVNSDKQKLHTHASELIDLSLAESKAENVTKSKKIKSLEFVIKILKSKLSSAQKDVISIQNDSSKKESEILSLRSKIAEVEHELASKVSELDCLKLETISKPVVGGDVEKNMQSDEQSSITKSDDISAISEPIKNLSQYFIRNKNMDQVRKIDGNISDHTRHDGITEPSKVDTEISSKINEETNINEISKDILLVQEIKNVTPHLAQPENHTSSLIESHPQISVGGIEAIPAVARTLMSPLSAYICLILLIIAVIWFVVLRRTWGLERKNERLRDACKEPSSPLYTDCIVTHSFMVVGMRFRGGHKFKKSDTITLEPEPSNTYDKNAIKIMVDGIHKAYVAKDENKYRPWYLQRWISSSLNGANHINNTNDTNETVISIMNEIDLSPLTSEFSDQPRKLEIIYKYLFAIQTKSSIQNIKLLEKKEREKLDIMEKTKGEKEKEKLEIMEKKEREKLDIMEKKEREKLDIMDELRKVENTLRDRTQELLRSRRI
ncbi:16917_t:CDS:2, partial [Entrophospora sp. SA101]